MKTAIAAPVALLAVLSLCVDSHDDVSPAVLSEEVALSACLPNRSPDSDGGRRYDAVILRHARKRGLNPRLVKAIIAAESDFATAAVSRCGARGLMQVMPATAEELGVKACDLSDPETNISAGTEYLARLFKLARRRVGREDVEQARMTRRVIAAYHSGPGALGAAVWSESTRRYVREVLSCCGPAAGAARAPRKAASIDRAEGV